jgi:hypothetical protein
MTVRSLELRWRASERAKGEGERERGRGRKNVSLLPPLHSLERPETLKYIQRERERCKQKERL